MVKDTKTKTATEVQMEAEGKMRREYEEWLVNDDKAFRSMVLAKLDSIEQRLNNLSNGYPGGGLFSSYRRH